MISQNQLFTQFGGGREGFWEEGPWLAVLKVLERHDGEEYTPTSNAALFADLQAALQGIGSNLSVVGSDDRPIFRAANGPWVYTNVAQFDQHITVTEAGRAVLSGNRTYADCLRYAFAHYRENRNSKNPFRPILELLGDGQAHTFADVFDAVQRECGPEMSDWLASSKVPGFPYTVAQNGDNPTRTVRLLLKLLKSGELAVQRDGGWAASDVAAVRSVLAESVDANSNAPQLTEDGLDVAAILDELNRAGWRFAPWQVAAFCNAIKTKPFVVLAGISGTGKTKLPRLVAKATGAEHTVIPVRPDWRDSSDLLGYTDLAGTFHPGPLLRAAKAAIEDQSGREHFVLLDEMNLARVEYYFAELLSLMEERYPDGSGGFRTAPLLSTSVAVRPEDNEPGLPWSDVYLPSNLALLGSVNMDETTHPFSRKVLDRAFVIEFSEVDLEDVGAGGSEVSQVALLPGAAWHPAAIRLAEHPDAGSASVRAVVSELSAVNEILKTAQLQIGYRLRDEVAMFVLNLEGADHLRDASGDSVDPLDLALCMKVMPRIQGGGPRTSALLKSLSVWAGPVDQPRLPVCFARIELLIDRLDAEGFTSFWL